MFEEDEKIYEEQRKELAQFFIDDYEYLSEILECMIEASSGRKKEELMKTKAEMDREIKDLYPIAKGNSRKGR